MKCPSPDCSGNPFLRSIPERSGGKIIGKDCSGKREMAPNSKKTGFYTCLLF